jgi:uncharacterized membrane protein (TIGR02234 family)
MMTARAEFALALALDLVGGAGALLAGVRAWQTIVTARGPRLLDDTLSVSGRTVDATPTALALVALAGAVAVIATHGVLRRVIGVVVGLAGAAIVWRAAGGFGAVSVDRARDLVRDKHPSAASTTAVPHITTSAVWPALTLLCGVVVLAAGALVAVRGGRWSAMSTRYESPAAQADPDTLARQRARADAALWSALDRGDDPTESDPRDTR